VSDAVATVGTVRIFVYVDGFNLYYGIKRWSGAKWLDIRVLVQRLFPNDVVDHIRYFTASIKAQGDPGAPLRQDVYLRALANTGNITIHRSTFLVRSRWLPLDMPARWRVPVIVTEEKGSDVSLGAHMIRDAFLARFDMAVVITNDSDLRDPVTMLQEPPLGMPVWVLNPHPRKAAALSPSVHLDLKATDIRASQLPRRIRLANGRVITRPASW
jgi:hypothetical protein